MAKMFIDTQFDTENQEKRHIGVEPSAIRQRRTNGVENMRVDGELNSGVVCIQGHPPQKGINQRKETGLSRMWTEGANPRP